MRADVGASLSNAAVGLALLGAWALCIVQLASAYQVWTTGAGIYGTPGGLAVPLYLPVILIYVVALPHATRRWHRMMAAAPILGTLALVIV